MAHDATRRAKDAVPERVLSGSEARRIAVRAQLLEAARPTELVSMVEHLGFLQSNVTAIVMPSAEHIAWSRLDGLAYRDVRAAVEIEQGLFEHAAQPTPLEPIALTLRPTSLLPELLPAMRAWPMVVPRMAAWVDDNAGFRDRVVALLREDGPLPQRSIPDTADVPWASSGWNTDRNVAMLLEFLLSSGVLAIVERVGAERVWDLAERVLPPVAPLDDDVARTSRARRVLRSLGIARPRVVEGEGVPVRIEGVRGVWHLDPDADGFLPRIAVLSPLDRLIFDRKRMRDLWGFDYALEQYTPAAKRRWGAFALPILDGEALVGKVDARTDRDSRTLRVAAMHWDVDADARVRHGVADELASMAAYLQASLELP